jgi:threonyl-tRNA synthetase
VRDAGQQWIPFTIVVGDRELQSDSLPITVREESTAKKSVTKSMTLQLFLKTIHDACQGKPFEQLFMSDRMSMWPIFI